MALIPSPAWLDTGNNAWQMTSGVLVGLMSIPGLAVLYGGAVKKKWAINSAFMVFYAFSAVLIVWLLWAYNMSFGPHWLHVGKDYFLGLPHPTASAADLEKQAVIPDAAAGMPPLTFPMSTMVWFQFVFAAITVIILAGSILGRVSFKAWMLFVPIWMTFVYTVGAFSLWGGGWLGQLGVVDYSGGYVIHLAAASSGFTAAAIIGPRLTRDRESFQPNSLLITLVGAGILWLGWSGFNGGDPYFANMDSSAAVLNTNVATAAALLTWTCMDVFAFGLPSVLGAVNGMICGLVAITPAAGYINGFEAIILGIVASALPWFTWNKVGKMGFMRKVDDTLGVIHTHGVAALVGGIGTGILANPRMIEYIGTGKDSNVTVTGWLYGNFHQVVLQVLGAVFIIAVNVVGTSIILNVIRLAVPLRLDDESLLIGDDAAHGEEAYAIYGDGLRRPVLGD
ncbi:MAG TPA: ammonium transporter [Acetobacteraceae bacterium]|nr:ammonium transporter [Acetobacteraceae bacterium]